MSRIGKPTMEVVRFENEDIVTASAVGLSNQPYLALGSEIYEAYRAGGLNGSFGEPALNSFGVEKATSLYKINSNNGQVVFAFDPPNNLPDAPYSESEEYNNYPNKFYYAWYDNKWLTYNQHYSN